MRVRALALALALSASFPCTALEGIDAVGGAPSDPYVAPLAPSHGDQTRQVPVAQSGRPYRLTHHLPIRSPSLSPGLVEAHPRPTRLLQPIFLVGADPQSLAWLEANRERLKHMGAIGMLVQAENEAELNQAVAAAHDLPLIPASGEAFAETLGIRHYPVLIAREGFEP